MSLKNIKADYKGKLFAGQLFRTQFLCTPDIQHEASVKKLRVYIHNESNFTEMEDLMYKQPKSIDLYCCQIWVCCEGATHFIEKS
jgi:hypothetical protein